VPEGQTCQSQPLHRNSCWFVNTWPDSTTTDDYCTNHKADDNCTKEKADDILVRHEVVVCMYGGMSGGVGVGCRDSGVTK
jgi:hypothetical protein